MPRVKRVPIKIRKPIYLDYCSCWGIKTILVEGTPRMILGDEISYEDLKDFIETTKIMLPVYFTENTDKIHLCLDNKIPVATEYVDQQIFMKMKDIPHCSVYLKRTDLYRNLSDTIEESYVLKSYKIMIGLNLVFNAYEDHIFDLYTAINQIKNYASHVFISTPVIHDDLIPDGIQMEVFKKYFVADVPNRQWVVKPHIIQSTMQDVKDYLKGKKVSVEYMRPICSDGRYRQIKEFSKEPMGMKPFYYKKIDGEFQVSEEFEGFDCPHCQKPIFA